MKLRIMQQGGGLIYTPFIPGAQGATTTSSKSSDSSEPKLDPLDKELISLMKDQSLLPSDIQQIYNRLIRFQKQTQSLSGLEGTDAYRSAMPGMLQILGMVNEAKYNKAQSDEIVKRMAQQNAGADVALDAYGRMYVYDKDGEMKKIDISEFDHEKHVAISNSQLLSMRQRQFGFQDNIMNDLENMVGMSSVQDEIAKIISKIGTAETSAYIKNPSANKVLQALMAEGPEGVYKLSQKDRSEGLQLAWNAIYTQLPQNMRNLLRANAAIFNTDPILMIQDIVLRSTDTKTDIDYDASASKAAGYDTDPNKTSEEKLQAEDNYQIRFATGQGMPISFALTPSAAKINDQGTFIAQALDFGPMLNMKELPIEQMNLQTLLFSGTEKSSALATSIRSTDVTFGNKLLDYSELPAILVNGGESLTTKVYLPYKNENGHYVPDFDKFTNFNNYISELKPNMSVTERNALLQKYNLSSSDIIPSEDGRSFTLKDTMPFLAFSGYAGDDTLKLTDDNKRFLAKVDRAKGKTLKDGYNNALKYNDVYAKKNSVMKNSGFDKATPNDFWEGIVFIPCPDSFYAYNSTKNQPVTKQSLTNISSKVIANNALNEARRQAMLDPNYDDYTQIGQFRTR